MARLRFDYRIVDITHSTGLLDISNMVDTSYIESQASPIDTFIEMSRELNKLLPGEPEKLTNHLSNLLVLGYISAVESFIRKLLRQLILIDAVSKEACEKCKLTYGAAVSYDIEMLPESLMEERTFTGKEIIRSAFKDLLGIPNNKYPTDVEDVLEQYSKVCQIRHCIVHRFGHIGSDNARKLGLTDYKKLLNKPVRLDFDTLQHILLVCNNTVKALNNFLFLEILRRTISGENRFWKWDYRKDKTKFKRYFELFYSKELGSGDPENECRKAYLQLKQVGQP
jgi:hypothetical protein